MIFENQVYLLLSSHDDIALRKQVFSSICIDNQSDPTNYYSTSCFFENEQLEAYLRGDCTFGITADREAVQQECLVLK